MANDGKHGGGRGGHGGGGRRRQQQHDSNEPLFEEVVVKVNRCAKVMKGGRRFSFSALVVVGNRDGRVGAGFGKARGVPGAVEKGVKDAKKSLFLVARDGDTIAHEVTGEFEASKVKLIPAAPGTGVVAGAAVRAVLELAGIKNVLTKVYGSKNSLNVVKATIQGLQAIRTQEQVESLRGVAQT